MSSKYKRPAPPRDPATLKVTRGDIINFMNFMSMDENFCLRVWNTVQAVYKREQVKAKADGSIEGGDLTVTTEDSALALGADPPTGRTLSDLECQPAEAVPA